MGIWENGVLKKWVTAELQVVPDKKNLQQEEKKVFKESKVQKDQIPENYFLKLPGKPKAVKNSAGNSPMRLEPDTLNPQ